MKVITLIFMVCIIISVGFSFNCNNSELLQLCKNHPDRIDLLFSKLNLNFDGLHRVKEAWNEKDCVKACYELLKYYETAESGKWLCKDIEKSSMKNNPVAENILKDIMVFLEVQATVPRDSEGFLDWDYSPNDDFQWTLFLNRHFHLHILMNAYLETGNKLYASRIGEDLKDWILSNPYPGKGYDYGSTPGNWSWTMLEVGSRAAIWPDLFYNLQTELRPDVKLLMLSSLPDHFDCLHKYHAGSGNHLAIELKGLSTLAGTFPEFKDSESMLDYSANIMFDSFMKQVYPDGVQNELTVHYHGVTFRAFNAFAEIFKNIDKPLPKEFLKRLDLMIDYMAYVQRPNGYGPLNNDSDYLFIRKYVIEANKKNNRNDWTYITTNGQSGQKPKRLSVFYPWAGQVVFRNGWKEDAHWAFFDIGPWGAGHRHCDKLHLSVTASGRDLLVDSGRYTYVGYKGGAEYPWRDFFINSESHNVIMVDGKGQKPKKSIVDKSLENVFITNPDFDFARGSYDEGYDGISDNISHTRGVLYLRDRFWIVVDRIGSESPHQIQVLWHYHPDCEIKIDDQSVTSVDVGRANLRVVPVSPFEWDVKVVKGQQKPHIQGWYSVEYNKKVPNNVAVYTASIEKPQTFVWLLLVDPVSIPEIINANILSESPQDVSIVLKPQGSKAITVSVPMAGNVQNVSIEKE